MNNYIFYNPLSSNGAGKEQAVKVLEYLKDGNNNFINMTEIPDGDYAPLFAKMTSEDKIILCGGDGTLNRFVNDCEDTFPDVEIYLFPTGTGNDFLKDIGKEAPCEPVLITEYLRDLPEGDINGKHFYFVNNVSFGIDGWICEEAEKLKKMKCQLF